MKVKAKDIAKAAGVSTTAVSLVLNGKDSRISEATKEKILRISREMAFQSEITVQPGGSQRVKTLGLVLPDLKDPVFYKLLIYIQEYAFQKGYMVFFCACGDDAERCCTIVEGLVVKNVDGLAVVAPSTLEKDDSLTKTLHTIQDNGVPLVLLDRAVYSIFSDFVTTDNKYGGRAAAETFMKSLKIAAIETHVADARTCCLNPATSTHRQMNDKQLEEAGVPAELVRMSCGIEDKEDLIADIEQALDKCI